MKKLIAMLLCIAVVLSLSTVAFANEAAPEILKGTAVVDGKLDDLYKDSLSLVQGKTPEIWVQNDTDNVEATVYFLHEGGYLYVCAVVTGDSAVVDTGAAGWACDGVDVWFLTPNAPTDPTRTKITLDAFGQPYDEDNKYIGQHENGLNVDLSKIEKAATRTDNGYITEAKIPVPYASESEGTIAINLQLNNVYDPANPTPNDGKFGFYGAQFATAPTTIVLSDTAAVVPEPIPEILKGTPVVDGKLDGLYEDSYHAVQGKEPVIWVPKEDADNVEATVYFLHDGEYLYVCAVITGDSAIVDTGAVSWACDGIDVWFLTPAAPSDPTRTKITLDAYAQPYDADNKYIGQHENGLNVDLSKVEKAAVRDEANKTYVVEAKLPIPYASESEGTIAINIQLNNVYDPADTGSGAYNGGFYGAQFATAPTTLALSDVAAVAPVEPTEPINPPSEPTPPTGDAIGLVVALMAVSGMALVVLKKKEF